MSTPACVTGFRKWHKCTMRTPFTERHDRGVRGVQKDMLHYDNFSDDKYTWQFTVSFTTLTLPGHWPCSALTCEPGARLPEGKELQSLQTSHREKTSWRTSWFSDKTSDWYLLGKAQPLPSSSDWKTETSDNDGCISPSSPLPHRVNPCSPGLVNGFVLTGREM